MLFKGGVWTLVVTWELVIQNLGLSPLPGGHSNSEHQQLQGSPAGGDPHKLRGQAPPCQPACIMEEKKSLILVPEVNPLKGQHSPGRDVASPQPLSV